MEGLITIPESGMIFGPFAQDQVFHDGLDPIKTKLEQTLRAYRAIWKLEIVVMNDKMAAKRGLIRSP